MKKYSFIVGIFLLIVSVLFTIALTKYDVSDIGPNKSSVGFSSLNKSLTFDYNEKIYKVSKYAGYVAFVIPVVYAGIGLYQLIKGKSFAKVDKRLYILAIFYILVLATYLFFEKVVINYRPVIIDNGLEPSFPSSHTLMSLFLCSSAIYLNKEMFKEKTKLINLCLFMLLLVIVGCRYISGVHWFTDIVGAVLIAGTLMSFFKASVKE